MVEIKITQLKQIMIELSKVDNAPSILILGEPGIGKSQVIKDVGKEVGREVIDFRLAQIEPADIGGIPKLQDTHWEYIHNELLLRATNEGVILFFDEMNQAAPQVLSAMFRLVLDRSLSDGTRLHPFTLIVGAGNDNFEDNFITDLTFALQNRFFIFKLLFDENEFLEYAKLNFIKEIYEFLEENRKFIYSRELNLTPRRWEQVNFLIRSGIDVEVLLLMLPVQLRKPLREYLKGMQLDIDFYIKNPEKILTLSPSEIEAVLIKMIKARIEKEIVYKIIKSVPLPIRMRVFNSLYDEQIPKEDAQKWIEILIEEDSRR